MADQNLAMVTQYGRENSRWKHSSDWLRTIPMPVGSTFANLSVAEWVQGHATNLAPELLPVIQSLSESLDHFETKSFYDSDKAPIAWALLQLPGHVPYSTRGTNVARAWSTSVAIFYLLSEVLLRVAGAGPQSVQPCIARSTIHISEIPDALEPSLRKLHDWPAFLKSIKVLALNVGSSSSAPSLPLPIPPHTRQERLRLLRDCAQDVEVKHLYQYIMNLNRLLVSDKAKRLTVIIRNFELAACMLSCYCSGAVEFADGREEVKEYLRRRTEAVGINLEQSFYDDLTKHLEPKNIRRPLEIAVTVSPIILLRDLEFSKAHYKTEWPLNVTIALGSERPKALQEVEAFFWRAIINIADDLPAPAEIFGALEKSLNLLETLSSDAIVADWFDITPVSPPPSPSPKSRYLEDEITPALSSPVTKEVPPANATTEADGDVIMDGPDLSAEKPEPSQTLGSKRPRSTTGDSVNNANPTAESSKKSKPHDEGPEAGALRRSTRIIPPSTKDKEKGKEKDKDEANTTAAVKKNYKKAAQHAQTKIEHSVKIAQVPHIPIDDSYGAKLKFSLSSLISEKDITIKAYCVRLKQWVEYPIRVGKYTHDEDESFVRFILACLLASGEGEERVPLYMSPDPAVRASSSVRMMTKEELAKCSPEELINEFGQRHIFIPATEEDVQNQPPWDLQLANQFAYVDKEFEAQNMCLRYYNDDNKISEEDFERIKADHPDIKWPEAIKDGLNIHVATSPRSMVETPHTEAILNLLDLRNPRVPDPPRQHDLASNEYCFQQVHPVNTPPSEPRDDARWGIMSHKGCVHLPHTDTCGVCTGCKICGGCKLWVTAYRQDGAPMGVLELNSIMCYGPNWDSTFKNPEHYGTEVMVMEAGSVFYMRPGALHCVFTLENTAMAGTHFYTNSVLTESVQSIVHSFMLDRLITNVSHHRLIIYRLEMVRCWIMDFESQCRRKSVKNPHMPQFGDANDIVKIMYWGLTVIFGESLDIRQYKFKSAKLAQKNFTPLPDHEEYAPLLEKTRQMYLQLMRDDYTKSFALKRGHQKLDVWQDFVCGPALHFAKAILNYHRTILEPVKEKDIEVDDDAATPLFEDQLTAHLVTDLKRLGGEYGVLFQKAAKSQRLSEYTQLLLDFSDLTVD